MIPLLLLAGLDALTIDELEALLNDDSPSSAVQSAHFDPTTNSVEVTFHRGGTYSFPCSLAQWLEYKESDSKGDAVNSLMGR